MAVRSFVALGANVGDRARTIHRAVQALQKYGTVEATASLVESAAAYVTERASLPEYGVRAAHVSEAARAA